MKAFMRQRGKIGDDQFPDAFMQAAKEAHDTMSTLLPEGERHPLALPTGDGLAGLADVQRAFDRLNRQLDALAHRERMNRREAA